MDEHVARLLLGVGDNDGDALAPHLALVADLAAALAVERRLVDHDGAALAGLQRVDFLAVAFESGDDALGAFGLVAEELGGAELLAQRKPHRFLRRLARARPRGARLRALALHGVGESRDINANAARAQRVLREIEREAIGVVEREGGVAVEHVALLEAAAFLFQKGEPARQHVTEAGLLQLQRLGDQRLGADAVPDRPAPSRG